LQHDRAEHAAEHGVAWLIGLQNDDGGWPTYYRDDALLKFDESATDVTAQVLRALAAWQYEWRPRIRVELARAIENGWKYLESQQRADGSFIPLWFGNEHWPLGENPVCGTAQVLLASADLDRLDSNLAGRAANWLVTAQHSNGGWGPPRTPVDYSGTTPDGSRSRLINQAMAQFCSIEETALATSALMPLAESHAGSARSVSRGLEWLIQAIEQDRHRQPAIVGFSLSKLWYDERLHPLAFAAGALARAVRRVAVITPAASHVG
jgi:squalene-hopene/tetraprenyl-beta-curcumene cyclase